MRSRLARATVTVAVEVDGYRLGEILVEVACLLLRKGLARDDCGAQLVGIINPAVGGSLPSNACSTLIASLALVSK